MNHRCQGIWKQFKGTLRARWGALAGGPRESGIQDRWAASNRAADRQLAEFMHRHRNWRDLTRR